MIKYPSNITIGFNFHPECIRNNNSTVEENKTMLEMWRKNYHSQVDEIFDDIIKEYF